MQPKPPSLLRENDGNVRTKLHNVRMAQLSPVGNGRINVILTAGGEVLSRIVPCHVKQVKPALQPGLRQIPLQTQNECVLLPPVATKSLDDHGAIESLADTALTRLLITMPRTLV